MQSERPQSQVPPSVESTKALARPKRACNSQYFVHDVSRGLYLLKSEAKDIEECRQLGDGVVVFCQEIKNMHKSSMMFNEVIGSWFTVAPRASSCSILFGVQTGPRWPPTPNINLSASLRAALTTLSFLACNKKARLCVGTFAWGCCLLSITGCHSPR